MITATHFYKFCRCPRIIYLDRYGDHSQKLPISEFMLHKMEQGRDYEKEVVSKIPHESITYKDDVEGAEKTLALLKKGTDELYQGVLMWEDMEGKPDLLEKKEGDSFFGKHYYAPCDIKIGLHAKDPYIMQVMFYCHLLEQIQEKMPEKAALILGDGTRVEFETKQYYQKFTQIMYDVRDIFDGKEVDVFLNSACKECQWHNLCLDAAEKKKDLSLVYKISKTLKEALIKNGINDIADASRMDISSLDVKARKDMLERIKQQSRAIVEKKIIKISNPNFPKKKKEIYFDIEGETELDVEYLFGLLVVKDGKEEYIDFTARTQEDEEKNWHAFIDFFKDLEDDEFIIYHYHSYEKRAMNKLKQRYGADEILYKKILSHMRDLFKDVTDSVYLPLYSYSIKPIARFIGFNWTSKDAGGAQSMLWYSNWLQSKDEKLLNKIIQYNKEDCIATRKVKEWLEKL